MNLYGFIPFLVFPVIACHISEVNSVEKPAMLFESNKRSMWGLSKIGGL